MKMNEQKIQGKLTHGRPAHKAIPQEADIARKRYVLRERCFACGTLPPARAGRFSSGIKVFEFGALGGCLFLLSLRFSDTQNLRV